MKEIPASTAFAIWMGVTLAGVKMIEVFFFKDAIKPMDFVYLGLILIAIIGLKKS
jgi:quaternary ammonium compound-resistance protein SugE